MQTTPFSTLLKDAMGLETTSIGASAIERAILERQRACGLDDWSAYWSHVRQSAAELQALIEAVVIAETWFFRDRGVFAALAEFVREDWRSRHHTPLRVLSLPCASGEEPYSIVMTLFDCGLQPSEFHVDGVDISERVLDQARAAVYGRGAFRGADLDFKARYFEPVAGGHRVVDPVRRQVTFSRDNVCSSSLLPGNGTYDVIFCRNVMIYFDRATQARVVDHLARLLAQDGLLFVGASETGIALERCFESARIPMAFAFRKRCAATAAMCAQSTSRLGPAGSAANTTTQGRDPASLVRRPGGRAAASSSDFSDARPDLEVIVRLADAGQLEEAARHCETWFRAYAPSAEAFHVRGLILDALGRADEAIASYRRALYLDPHHEGTLVQLSWLLEARRQPAEAMRLRDRARRVAESRGAAAR